MKSLSVIISFVFILFISLPAGLAAQAAEIQLIEIEVSPGDTLSRFAQRYLDEPHRWPELLEYNEIPTGNPNLIYPGDRIFVPVEMVRNEIADFVELRNQVRMRKSKQAAWSPAVLGERLYPDDGVRTSANSYARIQYLASDSYARIGENSLVFLTPEPAREDVVSLDVGQLRARDVKVLTDSAVIEPMRGSEYSAKVDEQKTTTLSVFRGSVDFISAGERVTVREGYMSRAEFDVPPIRPFELPEAPEFEGRDIETDEAPADLLASSDIDFSFFMDRINIPAERARRGEAEKILMHIASDEDFFELLVEEEVDRASPEYFAHDLPDGDYFWRVAFVDSSGLISRFSRPASFTVSTDPPGIIITSPEDGEEIASKIITLRGRAVPRSRIHINGNPVRSEADGSFVAGINLKYGENEINIKATDSLERITEKNITVNNILIEDKQEESKQSNLLITLGIISSALSIIAIALAIM